MTNFQSFEYRLWSLDYWKERAVKNVKLNLQIYWLKERRQKWANGVVINGSQPEARSVSLYVLVTISLGSNLYATMRRKKEREKERKKEKERERKKESKKERKKERKRESGPRLPLTHSSNNSPFLFLLLPQSCLCSWSPYEFIPASVM